MLLKGVLLYKLGHFAPAPGKGDTQPHSGNIQQAFRKNGSDRYQCYRSVPVMQDAG